MMLAGYAIMIFGIGLWIVGASSVNRRHRRRNGEEIEPFSARNIPTKELCYEDRRARRAYFWSALLIGAVGTFVASLGRS